MNESATYQELLAANRQLVAENELLRKENAKLSRLVKGELEGFLGCRVDIVRLRDRMNLLLRKRIDKEGIL